MNMVAKIRKKFANLLTRHALSLDGPNEGLPSWAIKFKNAYAVAIEIDEGIKVNESFSNVSYFTDYYIINNERKYLLILSSNEVNLRNEFAGVCALFLETGDRGYKRREIQKNPLDWWKKWKELIGNKSVDSTVHGVIGELIALYWMKKYISKNLDANNWTGPDGKSTDITTKGKSVEVKTSLIKYNNIVTISGQYQLDNKTDMSLVFIKLEEVTGDLNENNIISVDKMVDILSKAGMNDDELNKKVSRMGLKVNSMDRKRTYKLLEILEYPINDEFPIITQDSLKDSINKDRILQLTYKVELSGLTNNKINLNIN